MENPTSATSGPFSAKLIKECRPSAVVESRLHQSLDTSGSPEFVLDWSRKPMLSGPSICALRASGAPHPPANIARDRMAEGSPQGKEQINPAKAQRNLDALGADCAQTHKRVLGSTKRADGEKNKRERRGMPDFVGAAAAAAGCGIDTESPRQQAWTSDRMGANDQSRWNKGQLESEGGPDRMGDSEGFGRGKRAFTERSAEAGEGREKAQWSNAWRGAKLGRDAMLAGWATPTARDWNTEKATLDYDLKRQAHSRGKPLHVFRHWDGVYISCADGKARRIETQH